MCECPLLPFMPWPLAPFACMPLPFWPGSCPLLAAIASSVYAVLSPLAKTLKASRIGLYPVQRLHKPEHTYQECQDCIPSSAEHTDPGKDFSVHAYTLLSHAFGQASGAAAGLPEVACKRLLDLCLAGRLWLGAQEGVHGHDEPRRAEATLHARQHPSASPADWCMQLTPILLGNSWHSCGLLGISARLMGR